MRIAYYPGCSLDGSAVEYGLSTKRSAEILGVELVEIEDWNCCGATSGHNTNKLLSLALPARNLALAEKTGLDVLAPCAACYNRFRTAEHAVRHDGQIREKIEDIIEMEYKARNQTLSILEFFDKLGVDQIKSRVTQTLKGMKAACYYGCLLVRPVEHTGFDDAEDPQSMDKVVRALGADTVDWSHKTECCGAALATSRPDVGKRMIYEVLRNAREAGAECLVTACPLCMMNLDMRQAGVEKEFKVEFDLPVYYVTELLAVACGDSPRAVGVDRHFVEAESYLASLPAKAAVLEAAAPKPKKAKAEPEENADEADVKEKPSKTAVTPSVAPTSDEDAAALEKKVNAMIKGLQKNPDKMALKMIEDEERAAVLAEIIQTDEKKTAKLAELMVTDKAKAAKAADAYVSGELKKRGK